MEEDISCTDLHSPPGLWRRVFYKKKHRAGYWHCRGEKWLRTSLVPATRWKAAWVMSCIHSCITVCSMRAHPRQRWLLSLFVADRAGVLLAVRPNINKAFLSLIDGDSLNYRVRQGEENNPCKSFLQAPHISTLYVNAEKKKTREWMSRKAPMHFSLFRFLVSFCSFFGQTLSGLAIILGRYQCVAASSDQPADKG